MRPFGRIATMFVGGLALGACSDAGSVEGRVSGPAGDTTRYANQVVQLLRRPDSVRTSDSTLCAEYLSADSAVAVRFPGPDSSARSDLLEQHGDLIDHFASDLGEVHVDYAVQIDTTDAEGRFSFSNVPAGEYALVTMAKIGGGPVGWWWDEVTVEPGARVDRDLTSVIQFRSWCEHRYRSGQPSIWGAAGPP